jgi:hypothetical protein
VKTWTGTKQDETLEQWLQENEKLCGLWNRVSGLYAPQLNTRLEARMAAGKELPLALAIIRAWQDAIKWAAENGGDVKEQTWYEVAEALINAAGKDGKP